MSKLKMGDRVRVKETSKLGKVNTIYDYAYWGIDEDSVSVVLDDGNFVTCKSSELERMDEAENDYIKCECGLKFSRHGGKHSAWCALSYKN